MSVEDRDTIAEAILSTDAAIDRVEKNAQKSSPDINVTVNVPKTSRPPSDHNWPKITAGIVAAAIAVAEALRAWLSK